MKANTEKRSRKHHSLRGKRRADLCYRWLEDHQVRFNQMVNILKLLPHVLVTVEMVSTIDAAKLTLEKFFQNYVAMNIPVVIKVI
jgi:hypothetical protein